MMTSVAGSIGGHRRRGTCSCIWAGRAVTSRLWMTVTTSVTLWSYIIASSGLVSRAANTSKPVASILASVTFDQLNSHSTGWRKKTCRTFSSIIQPSGRNESVQKYICNDQTSPNMCRNFCLEHFCISHDRNEITPHATKQFLQAAHHLHWR